MMEIVKKLVDVKAVLSALVAIIMVLGAALSQLEALVSTFNAKSYAAFTKPAYLIVEYDLLKQLDKLQDDFDDVKQQDIVKFTEFCDGYFLEVYAESRPSIIQRNLHIACDKVIDLYSEGQRL